MSFYIDPLRAYPQDSKVLYMGRGKPSCHLATNDDLAALHAFAHGIGVPKWQYHPGRLPHYDLLSAQRERAIDAGTVAVSSRDLVRAYRAKDATHLYTDGGVLFDGIKASASTIGGMWAWRHVVNDVCVRSDEGFVTPGDIGLPEVTNNVTELLALVYGIEALPVKFAGIVASDSWNALQRVFLAARLNNVPAWLVDRLQAIQRTGRLAGMKHLLHDGHPTKAQLAVGVGKRGKPVSVHNVACDAACGRVGAAYVAQMTASVVY